MHIVFRESHGLEETETPFDPGQDPAELVALSFSDSDLGAFAAGWHRAQAAGRALPSLRLVNLAALRHPVSVDNYAEATLRGAKAVLVRLIGGEACKPWRGRRGCASPSCRAMAVLTQRWTRSPLCPSPRCASWHGCARWAAPPPLRPRWPNWPRKPGWM
jgi:hypothetical protein